MLGAIKYSKRSYLTEGLADAAWDHQAEVLARCDLVTAIPLVWTRRLKRGFNQSELIARRLAALLGRPYLATLDRTGRAVQSRSSRSHRRRNVVGSFRLRTRKRPLLEGADLLLVDDVVTTGSTLEAAARVLIEGGANRVTALALVRTPLR